MTTTPTPFELAMIAAQIDGKTSRDKADAALELWDTCRSLLDWREWQDKQRAIDNEIIAEELKYSAPYPTEPARLSVDDFLRQYHPRAKSKTKSMPEMRKDFDDWMQWRSLDMKRKPMYPGCSIRLGDECPYDCPVYVIPGACDWKKEIYDLKNGIPPILGENFIQYYEECNRHKKSKNGRKGFIAKKLKQGKKAIRKTNIHA